MEAELAASTITPKTTSMASAGTAVGNDRTPRMNITVETAESVYFTLSPVWRATRTTVPLTAAEKAAEKADYYKAYDPLTGLKIAATLSGLLTMAVLYVFYKVANRVPRPISVLLLMS